MALPPQSRMAGESEQFRSSMEIDMQDIMPGWNGHESIVAYHIRMRNERRAREARNQRWFIGALWAAAIVGSVIGLVLA